MRRTVVGLTWTVTAALACRDASAPREAATTVRMVSGEALAAAAGTALAPAPTFVVTGPSGAPLAGIAVSVTVVEGGGTVSGTPTRSANAPASIGQWTLGPRAGRNVLQVQVAGLAPLLFTAAGAPGAPAAITVVNNGALRALAGTQLTEPLVLAVSDQFGNGVSGVALSLASETPGAAITPLQLISGAEGRTPAVAWRLAARERLNRVRVSAPAHAALSLVVDAQYLSSYTIDVRFKTPPSAEVQRIFSQAAERISAVIVGEVDDVPLVSFDPTRCGGPVGLTSEQVDDVIIYADVSDIDGAGRILGRAGPCLVRATSRLTILGSMQFDAADTPNLISSGRFESVVLHEMLHVIGIGSLWRTRSLVEGEGSADPRFVGAQGTQHCMALGFSAACSVGSVPVENTGGSGTAGVHWRESTFDAELMTGFAEATAVMPLSAVSVGSLEDFGYVVNHAAADPFTPPASARWAFPGASTKADEPFDVVLRPIGEVTAAGWLRRY